MPGGTLRRGRGYCKGLNYNVPAGITAAIDHADKTCINLQIERKIEQMLWWAVLDSNQRPKDYESSALTD